MSELRSKLRKLIRDAVMRRVEVELSRDNYGQRVVKGRYGNCSGEAFYDEAEWHWYYKGPYSLMAPMLSD